jgi:hypothetical protein
MKSNVPDLASNIKEVALREIEQKNVKSNIYTLTSCANPYAVDNIIIIKESYHSYKVFQCGVLVFYMVNYDLRKYTCGNWTDKLASEVNSIKAQRASVKAKDRLQSIKNSVAKKNYVLCHQ